MWVKTIINLNLILALPFRGRFYYKSEQINESNYMVFCLFKNFDKLW